MLLAMAAALALHAAEDAEIAKLRADIAELRSQVLAMRQELDRLQQIFAVARPGAEGQQKLEAAILAGDATAVEAVLAQKINPNLKLASGKLPIELAVDGGRLDVFVALLRARPNPRINASVGGSLASYVKAKGTPEMIEAARAQKPDWNTAMEALP
jgi:ankyrin repeat protein